MFIRIFTTATKRNTDKRIKDIASAKTAELLYAQI
jgi:hypothetical protein